MTGAAVPRRVRPPAHLRVIAPSRSMRVVSADVISAAERCLGSIGFSISYGAHVWEVDAFDVAPVEHRVRDLHEAYTDPAVDGILTAIGGLGCVELLPHLNWQLLRDNPKPICGYSDVTALLNAITHRSGTVTYCGPHFSSFAMPDPGRFQANSFLTAIAETEFEVRQSVHWSDEAWYLRLDTPRIVQRCQGWRVLNRGRARGRLIGGNLTTLGLLQGTAFAPPLACSILLVEDIAAVSPAQFRNRLAALALQPGADELRGLLIGRFQREAGMSAQLLGELPACLPDVFRRIPVVADVDCGHTQPIATFAIGADARLDVDTSCSLTFRGRDVAV